MPDPDRQTQDSAYGLVERAALAAAAIIMLGIVGASGWLSVNNESRLNDAAATQDIRARTVDLLQAVTQAETAQRGYLLTGKDIYLAPYTRAVAAIAEKMAELNQTVALAKAGRHEDALAVVASDRGQTLMEGIATLSATLTGRQRAMLARDLGSARQGARAVVVVDVVAFLLLALLTLFVTGNANATVARLRATRAALQAANEALEAGRARLEIAVQERTAELTLANEEIQRFAYIVSHDLRAPLLNIIGFTSELEVATAALNDFVHTQAGAGGLAVPPAVRAASEEDLPEAIRFIQTSTAKMDRLINAILRLSREGRRMLVPEQLDMNALLRAAIDNLAHQAASSGAEITLADVPALVSDRIAVDQVFSNLIDNALKYAADGRPGRIAIAGRREGVWVVVEVRDNGRGIAARDMARVFELFRRAGNQDRPGEGIGLAHVKALVRRLGGAIDCTSSLGEGSVFSVRLPAILTHARSEQT
jgi:signal transduction histidine kinase